MRTRLTNSIACLAFGFSYGLAGCSADEQPAPQAPFPELTTSPSFPGTPGAPEDYAELFSYQPLANDCRVSNPSDLAARTELRIFRGAGVPSAEVKEFLGGLQRYYDQYGVTMFTRHDELVVPLESAMSFDMDALTVRIREETGIDLESTDEISPAQEAAVLQSMGRGILHSTRELLRVYATPRRDVVNVVLLKRIADDLPDELADFAGIAGLGLSYELLQAFPPGDPGESLYEWLDIEGEFTPTAIIGVEPVRQFIGIPDIVMAHELGHAYGLVHVTETGNLLRQGEIACWLSLSEDQLSTIRSSTQRFAHISGIEAMSLTSRASEFVLAIDRLVHRRARTTQR